MNNLKRFKHKSRGCQIINCPNEPIGYARPLVDQIDAPASIKLDLYQTKIKLCEIHKDKKFKIPTEFILLKKK